MLATDTPSPLADLLIEAAECAGRGVVLYAVALRWAMDTRYANSEEKERRVRSARLVTKRIDVLQETRRGRSGQKEQEKDA